MTAALRPSAPQAPAHSSGRLRHAWGEAWRFGSATILSVVLVLVLATSNYPGYEAESRWWIVEIGAGLASLGLLFFRRRRPIAICASTIVLSSVAVAAVPPAAIAFISLSTRRRWAEIVVASIGWLGGQVVYELLHPMPQRSTADIMSSVIMSLLSTAFCVAVGVAIGARRELVANLRRQVQVAGEQEKSRVQQARLGERSRIAREMHDVLAHRISLVAMHSGALAYRTGLSEQQVREAAEIIRDNSQIALTELREVLGVLRDAENVGIEPPQPNLSAVQALVQDTPTGDGPIDLVIHGDLDDIPESLSRSGFRVVQEVLTNRRKHARGVPITIDIDRDEVSLRIRTSNPVTRQETGLPESGLGLLGLTERVELAGGSLHYGIDRSERFVVKAVLPMLRDSEKVGV